MKFWVLFTALIYCSIRLDAVEDPLVTLEYHVVGTRLSVSPPVLSVPKGIAGSVRVDLVGADSSGNHVEAILRGPSFPARRVIGQANDALLLPPLPLVGDYELNDIKLVDGSGATVLEGSPNRVPIHVFDDLLVSRVTSRPLTLDEIRDKGIVIDDKNFRAVEFEVGFVLDGKTIPVTFPVVAPRFAQSSELIPAAELEARLKQADAINQDLAFSAHLPPELETGGLNIQMQGINFQPTEEGDGGDLRLSVPPIPALMVIPGNIGFLNQFFSVQIFTENAAPSGSGLAAANIQATLHLPPGPDLILSTNYDLPGDDPLRFARVGPNKIVQPIQAVVRPGPDGIRGTADDVARLLPGETGEGEFLVEGLQEGLHVMDMELTADLEGLAAGIVKVRGKAAGSVLVRNPKFSLAFSHPRTVRAGEPYDAFVTVLNTSSAIANLVQVTLPAAAISGGVLESDSTVVLGTIQPGETATAKFRIRAQRTGAITFSNLTTSDESLVGRFRLRVGLDERGVALSPDMIAMPDFATNLPPALLAAANRVLGQALSVATAPQLPPGVKPINKSVVTTRVLELAEAGQRIRYHDPTQRVLMDLLLDWQGARSFNEGFDQIVRQTDAGREFRDAIFAALEQNDNSDATARLGAQSADLAGRGEAWVFASSSSSAAPITLSTDIGTVTVDASGIPQAAEYAGGRGLLCVAPLSTNGTLEWHLTSAVPRLELSVVRINADGTGSRLTWDIANADGNSCFRYGLGRTDGRLELSCDGSGGATLEGGAAAVHELPPAVISAIQDLTVQAGRPSKPCSPLVPGLPPANYGTILAILFSKPMRQEEVNVPGAYGLDNGNGAGSVQIQPGGRVALLNMKRPFGAIIPRSVTVTAVTDPRGNPVTDGTRAVESDAFAGVAVRGRVARADGSPAAGIPVTLTMYDQFSGFDCEPFTVRTSQVLTDEGGRFDFDYVSAGIPYSVSATDTSGLSGEAVQAVMAAGGDEGVDRDRLLDLANSGSAQSSLLQAFAVGAMPQAIAKAEGLDRALLRDLVPLGSGREGAVVPVALRFRGRAAVQGVVVSADGVTPAANAAVNLFPDPDSRELGRGVFADSAGRFAFFGVPLGSFGITADNGAGLSRTVSGSIDVPGGETNVVVVLSEAPVARTGLAGRVLEADSLTPHTGASVFVGRYVEGKFGGVVAVASTDGSGFWQATNVPARTYDVVAVSLDGKRKGERRDIPAVAGNTNQVTVTLQGFSVVAGRVETALGVPVANAIVSGGEALVRTDENGLFRLAGVPTGDRIISAGVERTGPGEAPNSTPAFGFPRVGSARVTVLPGVDNFVVVSFPAAGSVVGRVVDETGTRAVTNINVAMPQQGGFSWVPVKSDGSFAFEGLPLGRYVFSAPAPAVFNTDVTGLLRTIGDQASSEGDVQAAIGEAFAIFTGAADPLINGEGANFNPASFGFTDTELVADGQVMNIIIRFLRQGSVSGTVLNSQGVPIGARVRLTGIGPSANGSPVTMVRGEQNSDPALGTFAFVGQVLAGDWGLQASSPFFATVVSTSGKTSDLQPDATNIVLQFPSARDQNGRLAGTIFGPDGTPMGAGVKVKIRDRDFQVTTLTNGTFAFGNQFNLPAVSTEGQPGVGYFIEAEDDVTGGVGAGSVAVFPGVTNLINIRLLGKGALQVNVLQNDGSPAAGARVAFEQGSYPQDRGELAADSAGRLLFQNLFEGAYAVDAQLLSGQTTLQGRVSAAVSAGSTNIVTIRLGPVGTIQGRFVRRDLTTPVAFAQVAVGELGFATTDLEGSFSVSGVPLGTYRLVSHDPVTGIGAAAITTLSSDGQTNEVVLVEQSRGEIHGTVIASDGAGVAPAALVTAAYSDGITPPRSVTAGPDGAFSFPGSPAGAFSLKAEDPVTHLQGKNEAVLPDNVASFQISVALEPLGSIVVTVLRPGGVVPATNVTVSISGSSKKLNADSLTGSSVRFDGLPLDGYRIVARSQSASEDSSAAEANATVASAGQIATATLTLAGIGSITGKVLQSDGLTPVAGAAVALSQRAPFGDLSRTVFSDGSGRYRFDNAAVADYQISTTFGLLGVSVAGSIGRDGELDTVDLRLAQSGAVIGRLVRADGITPVAGEDATLSFPGSTLGAFLARTDALGRFGFKNVPVRDFLLASSALEFDGIARQGGKLTANGETNDLGTLVMDEESPHVISVTPPDTSANVPVNLVVELRFNEALASNTVSASGIFLQGGTNIVAATVQLARDTNGVPRIVRLKPASPLRSLTTYQVVVSNGDRKDALGQVVGSGPQDLVGRPLAAPFLASFTTADSDPPQLISIFPTNGAVQIDPRSIPRLAFNEPIQAAGFSFTVSGPAGPVPGTAATGLNGQTLVFTPAADLDANATYTMTIGGIRDLAGNLMRENPLIVTFQTLDTFGPNISTLQIAGGLRPVAGRSVPVEAILAAAEAGASVRFTQDFTPMGTSTNSPYRVNVTLPSAGSTTVRAIATDRFGNDGPVAELVIAVVSNQPPVVQLSRLKPVSGPVGNGDTLTVEVAASDDGAVAQLSLSASGALTFSTNLNGGDARSFSFVIPSAAFGGAAITFAASATDDLGIRSMETNLVVAIADTLPPQVSILSPPSNSTLDPASPLLLDVLTLDNSTNISLTVVLSGAISAQQTAAGAGVGNAPRTNRFTLPLTAAIGAGGLLNVAVTASDPAGNQSTAATAFRIADTRAPILLSSSLTNNTPQVSLWLPQLSYVFDEALDPATVTTNTVRLTTASGLAPFSLRLDNNGSNLVIVPAVPLTPGTKYTATVSANVADAAGNAPFKTPLAIAFTTSAVRSMTPTNGTPIVPGQSILVAVALEPGFGADSLQITVNGDTPIVIPADGSGAFAVGVLLRTNATSAQVRLTVQHAGAPPFVFPVSSLNVRPRGADDDGDGWLNGFEADRGMDPFSANPDSEDFDHDGLTNGQERTLGTDPANPDSDGDGLSDGLEVARGTNPVNPDTDGDGLIDSVDPDPLQANLRVVLSGPGDVTVIEGERISFTVQAQSANSSVSLLDFASPKAIPAFASVLSRTSSNTSSNGAASLTIELNPLHDAAGEYALNFRSTARNGDSGTFAVRVHVQDQPNLAVTRWAAPVSGNWSDASRWTAGTPGAGQVGVIDATGADYVVSVDVSPAALGIVCNSSNAVLRTAGNPTIGAAVEVRSGEFRIDSSTTIVLNGPLANQAKMTWVSRNNVFDLQGVGRIQNAGVWEIFADPGCPGCSAESIVRLPVEEAGLLLLSRGLVNFTQPSSLTVSGQLNIEGDGRLRMDGSNPGRDLTLLNGSVLRGDGSIQVEGGNRMIAPGDLDTTLGVNLRDAGQLLVSGTYFVRSSRSMSGTVSSDAVIIATNATLSVSSANFIGRVDVQNGGALRLGGGTVSFQTNVVVRAGAVWEVASSTTVALNGPATNFGTLHWISRNNVFDLQGSGRVENAGLWEVFADSACPTCSAEAVVRVPVNVPAGGKLLLSGGLVNFTQPSSLTVAGTLEIENGGRLRLDGSNPSRDLVLLSGSVLAGDGRVQLEGSSRLVAPGDFDSTVALNVFDSAQLMIPGVYTVRSNRSMSGTVSSDAVIIATNATLSVSSANFIGRVDVQNGGALRLGGGTVSFQTNVVVRAGAVWEVASSTTVALNGPATNFGTLHWISRNNVFDLQGSGRVENAGLWEVFADSACPTCSAEAVVRVPVNVPAGGKLLLSGGLVNFTQPSSLTVAGTLEIENGGRLRLDGSSPQRALDLLTGSTMAGNGVVQFEGANELSLPANAFLSNLDWRFLGASTISGSSVLTIGSGASVSFDHSSIYSGSIDVQGTLGVSDVNAILSVGGTLTLESSGTINNSGAIKTGAFVNRGGTIVGTAPSIGALVLISGLRVPALSAFSSASVSSILLEWGCTASGSFTVESSVDMQAWQVETAVMEASSNRFSARIQTRRDAGRFYRIRLDSGRANAGRELSPAR